MTENPGYALLITEEESLALEAIAQSVVPYSQRAQALLAVDAGSTVDQAAGVAGLSTAQVRYWITRFRNTRLQIFPEELLGDIRSLVRERARQDKALKKPAKPSAEREGRSKKEKSNSAKRDEKPPKSGQKKKGPKAKASEKVKASKEAKGKKEAKARKEAKAEKEAKAGKEAKAKKEAKAGKEAKVKKDKSAKSRKDKKKKGNRKKKGSKKNA